MIIGMDYENYHVTVLQLVAVADSKQLATIFRLNKIEG